jgi:hypothetical protein
MTPEELENNINDEKSKNEKEQEFLQDYLKKATNVNVKRSDGNKVITDKIHDLNFQPIQIEELPSGGLYYRSDIEILIRAARTEEIEQYSAMDPTNLLSVTEEIIRIINACCRVRYSDGLGSTDEIKEPDRYYLLFMIRDLTFQNKGKLEIPYYHEESGEEGMVEVTRENFEMYEVDEDLREFYSENERCFIFPTVFGEYKLGPPTLGVQNSFFEFINDKRSKKRKINKSMIKILPFMLHNKKAISIADIDKMEMTFKNLSAEEFSFLNEVCDKMALIGLKGLKHFTTSGAEVHTEITFSNGFASIFNVSGKFTQFIKK